MKGQVLYVNLPNLYNFHAQIYKCVDKKRIFTLEESKYFFLNEQITLSLCPQILNFIISTNFITFNVFTLLYIS